MAFSIRKDYSHLSSGCTFSEAQKVLLSLAEPLVPNTYTAPSKVPLIAAGILWSQSGSGRGVLPSSARAMETWGHVELSILGLPLWHLQQLPPGGWALLPLAFCQKDSTTHSGPERLRGSPCVSLPSSTMPSLPVLGSGPHRDNATPSSPYEKLAALLLSLKYP